MLFENLNPDLERLCCYLEKRGRIKEEGEKKKNKVNGYKQLVTKTLPPTLTLPLPAHSHNTPLDLFQSGGGKFLGIISRVP